MWMNTGEICYSVWHRRSLWRTAQINLEILFSTVMLRDSGGNGVRKTHARSRDACPAAYLNAAFTASITGSLLYLTATARRQTQKNGSHSTVCVSTFAEKYFNLKLHCRATQFIYLKKKYGLVRNI